MRCTGRSRGEGDLAAVVAGAGTAAPGRAAATLRRGLRDLALCDRPRETVAVAALDDRPSGLRLRGQGHAGRQGYLRHHHAVLELVLHLPADCSGADDSAGVRSVPDVAADLDCRPHLGPAVGVAAL